MDILVDNRKEKEEGEEERNICSCAERLQAASEIIPAWREAQNPPSLIRGLGLAKRNYQIIEFYSDQLCIHSSELTAKSF